MPAKIDYSSHFKGKKSKEVLEQEIFSLWNAKDFAKSKTEEASWLKAWGSTLGEYTVRFGGLDPLKEWRKWAKRT